MDLVKCETVDLAVPASAEIVIEGEIRPRERLDEGPFGEYTGYMVAERTPRPVIHVKAITHRNNPIFTMSCPGMPIDDDCVMAVTKGSEFLAALRERGLPVTGVCVFPEAAVLLTAVAVKNPYPRVAEDIAHIIWGTRYGRAAVYTIIVEDDVDPFDMGQVLHALATKCHPYRGIVRMEHSPGTALFPWANAYERRHRLGAKVYFDCTWPLEWDPAEIPKKISFKNAYPKDVQDRVLIMWHKRGY